jgi:hypothetical protein
MVFGENLYTHFDGWLDGYTAHLGEPKLRIPFISDLWDQYQGALGSWERQTSYNIVGGAATGLIGAAVIGYIVLESGIIQKIIKEVK